MEVFLRYANPKTNDEYANEYANEYGDATDHDGCGD